MAMEDIPATLDASPATSNVTSRDTALVGVLPVGLIIGGMGGLAGRYGDTATPDFTHLAPPLVGRSHDKILHLPLFRILPHPGVCTHPGVCIFA